MLVVALVLLAGCADDGGSERDGRAAATAGTEVELLTATFVDGSRSTVANGDRPARPDRTIETRIFHPDDAGPHPLVVFAHGFGGDYDTYDEVTRRWAAAGYVVASPRFPLTHTDTPGGVNGADVEQQPADVSFVIDELIAASGADEGELAGLIDRDSIAVAGHSNGGITTIGAVANSCCRDDRIDAAIVLAGVNSPFSGGSYDLAETPPILFVHGTEDQAIGYDESVRMFNEAEGPKGHLTVEGGEHGDWLTPDHAAFDTVIDATVDFLDGYLGGDEDAIAGLAEDGEDGVATMRFAAADGAATTIPTVPPPRLDRKATASKTSGLTAGEKVTVTWSGFLPGKTINIVQCTDDGRGGTATCDLQSGHILRPNPTGEGSVELPIVVGTLANGSCDAAHPCTILVNDAGLQEEAAFIYIPITFVDR